MKLDTVISACSLDWRFLPPCIESARQFSKRLTLVLCDRLFDGTEEPPDFIEACRRQMSMLGDVVVFPYDSTKDSKWHHNQSRWLGIQRCTADHICLLDADEIVDAERTMSRLLTGLAQYWAVSLACYWYFRSARYQADAIERCGLICERKEWTEERAFTEHERYWMGPDIGYCSHLRGFDGRPLAHHLSWVHTKAEMLRKVAAWGHRGDQNWTEVVEAEMSNPFDCKTQKDFVHQYGYTLLPEPAVRLPREEELS